MIQSSKQSCGLEAFSVWLTDSRLSCVYFAMEMELIQNQFQHTRVKFSHAACKESFDKSTKSLSFLSIFKYGPCHNLFELGIRIVKGSQVENGGKRLEKKKLVLTLLRNTNRLISSMLFGRYTCFNHSLNKVFKAFYTKIVNTPNFCAENKGGGIMACFFYTC